MVVVLMVDVLVVVELVLMVDVGLVGVAVLVEWRWWRWRWWWRRWCCRALLAGRQLEVSERERGGIMKKSKRVGFGFQALCENFKEKGILLSPSVWYYQKLHQRVFPLCYLDVATQSLTSVRNAGISKGMVPYQSITKSHYPNTCL